MGEYASIDRVAKVMGQLADHNEIGRAENCDDKSHAGVVSRLVGSGS
jgi:hypothetical protein